MFRRSRLSSMRIKSATAGSPSTAQRPKFAPISGVSQPLELQPDYTPFPLPRGPDSDELLNPLLQRSVDKVAAAQRSKTMLLEDEDERQQQHLQQQRRLVENIVAATHAEDDDDDVAKNSIAKQQKQRSASSSTTWLHSPSSSASQVAAAQSYLRDPQEPEQIERPVCVRPMRNILEQLTAYYPNFQRNTAALADVTDFIEDFLEDEAAALRGDGTAATTTISGIPADDADIVAATASAALADFRSRRRDTIVADVADSCTAVKSIFIGGGRSLFFSAFEDLTSTTKLAKQAHETQRIFFKYFGAAERFIVSYALPKLESLIIEQQRGEQPQQEQQQKQQKEVEQLLSAITEYMSIVAHFQTLDHRRHFDRNEHDVSGRLLSTHVTSVPRGRWEDMTGNDCFDALTNALSNKRFISALPTRALADWFLLFGSSFERLVADMPTHAELRQKLAEELVLGRLLPACKKASALRQVAPYALFRDAKEESASSSVPPLLLGIESGVERGAVISDILLACALSNVTLPHDFLEEALIQPALGFAELQMANGVNSKQRSTGNVLTPNFFAALAQLMRSKIPTKSAFRLAELEFALFQRQQQQQQQQSEEEEIAKKSADDDDDNNKWNPSGFAVSQEHDWINALFDIAFATHNRSAAIVFLQDQVKLNEFILRRTHRFAHDTAGDAEEITQETYGGLPPEMTDKRLQQHLQEGDDVEEEDNNNKAVLINVSAHTSGELLLSRAQTASLSSKEIAAFPTLLGLAYAPPPSAEESASPSSAYFGTFLETNAGHKIAASRIVYILHHSLLRGPSLDGFREILEKVREQSAALLVPASCLYHLAESTADVTSVCGRRPFLAIKRRALRALFEELRDNSSVVLVSPEEEAALRFHEGFAYGDSIVWEVKNWLESRMPTSKIVVACDEESRTRYRFAVFKRNVLATEKVEEREKPLDEVVSDNAMTSTTTTATSPIHPVLARARGIVGRRRHGALTQQQQDEGGEEQQREAHAPRTVPGSNRHQTNWELELEPYGMFGDAGNVAGGTSLQSEIGERFVSQFRIRDPMTNRKFQPGLWRAGNRAEIYHQNQTRLNNQVAGSASEKQPVSRRLSGHAKGSTMEDLRALGIMTPGHQQQ